MNTDDVYEVKLVEWKAKLLADVEIKIRDNSMTQYYYTKKILSIYIKEIRKNQHRFEQAILQKDNDLSHEARSKWDFAWLCKRNAHLLNKLLTHSFNSSDLNLNEDVWNILKQRIRKQEFIGIEELKRTLNREWWRIPQIEIQRRIDEMPERCKRVIATNGQFIKTELW